MDLTVLWTSHTYNGPRSYETDTNPSTRQRVRVKRCLPVDKEYRNICEACVHVRVYVRLRVRVRVCTLLPHRDFLHAANIDQTHTIHAQRVGMSTLQTL